MIKNERQYKISNAWLREFKNSISVLKKLPESKEQPWLRSAQIESIEEQIGQLQKQISDYERLKSGKVKIPDPVHFVSQTSRILIQSRIAKGWDQEELAKRLGMAKQQIQRYEQHDYAQATLGVLARIAAVLSGLPEPEPQPSPKADTAARAATSKAQSKTKATASAGTKKLSVKRKRRI